MAMTLHDPIRAHRIGPRSPASVWRGAGTIALLLPLLLGAGLARAGEGGHGSHAAHRAAAGQGALDVQLHDLELVTQDGKKVRFESDVIGDRLVAIAFTYTSCSTICPIFGGLFQEVQAQLGERLGRDVVLVTLTLDPVTDVPQRLQREARRYGARPGWFYLTGEKENVDQVLRGLDAYSADFTQHAPLALVGDGRTGAWKRFNGIPKPADLVAALDALGAARGDAQAQLR